MDSRQLDKMAQFEQRMEVVAKDNPDLSKACRAVHSMLTTARHVAESVFNDDVADQPEVVMQISAAIADELDEMNAKKEEDDYEDDEDGEHA
jgi:hypothetical protein